MKDALEAKSRVFARVLGADGGSLSNNCVGLGAGRKRGGFCLRVYVRKKLPRPSLGQWYLPTFLKHLIDDFPIDVVETGVFLPLAGPTCGNAELRVGTAVKIAGAASSGRIGGFVEAEGKIHLLSCSHVLDGRGQLGQAVFSGNHVVGHLSGQEMLQPERPGGESREDCARAVLAEGVIPSFDLPEPLGRLSTSSPAYAEVGMAVWKAAREVESGITIDLHADMRVHYPSVITVLRNQLLIHKPAGRFSRPGDSGAMVVTKQRAKCEALGIIVGANRAAAEWTLVTPMARVLAPLGSQLVIS